MHSRNTVYATILIDLLWFNVVHYSSLFQYFFQSSYYVPYFNLKFLIFVYLFHLKIILWKHYLIQNSPAVKNGCGPKKAIVKKMWNPRWQPRNDCDGRLMAKFLITPIQVNLCCLLHYSLGFNTWIVVIKKLQLAYHHSHFLAATLDLTMTAPFFTAGLFWIRFHFFLQLHTV